MASKFEPEGKPMCIDKLSRLAKSLALVYSCSFLLACSGSASDYIKEGSAYLDKGDMASALISFKNAVQADPKSIAARQALADALERNGDLPGAEQQLRRALESGGDPDQLFPKVAILLLDRGENALLIRDLGKQKLKSPIADSDLKALVALAYLASSQPSKAAEQLAAATERTPGVRLAHAQVAFAANHRAEAAAEMDAILTEGKAPWWVARAASRVFLANREAVKGLQAIKQSYDAAPMHRGVIGEYAEQLIAANRKDEARPLRDKLRKLAPSYYRTQYLEALFLLEDGKQDLAYNAITKVLAALPEHIPSQIIAASIELERNELSSAEGRVKRILAADTGSSQGYRLRAMLEMRRGNLSEASAALEKATSRAPDDRNLLAMAAGLSWSRGDKRAAVHQMSKAAAQEPPRADLLAGLAEMLLGTGQREDALTMLNSAASIAKDAKAVAAVLNAALRMKQLGVAKNIAEKEQARRPKDPEPLLWLAVVQGTDDDETGALAYVRKALDAQPDYYPALTALVSTAKTSERRSEYETRLKKAIESRSKDARVYLDQARILIEKNARDEQIGALLGKGLTADPTDLALREATIQHWLKSGQKDKALAVAKEGEAAMPENANMLAMVAYVQEAAGELSQSAIKYAQLAERFPDRLDWNFKHARNLSEQGKKQDAEKVLRRLIQQRSDEPSPYQALAMLQVEMGLSKEAQLTAEMLRDKAGQKALGLILLGDVYGATDRRPEAIKNYVAAAQAGLPELALQKKVRLLDQTGGGVLAASEIANWLSAHPDNVVGLSLAAGRASDRGEYAEAAKYLERIVKKDPENPVALNDLAWAYVMAKNNRAIEVISRAIRLAPENPVILDTLSQAQLLVGEEVAAMTTARKALSLDNKSAVLRIHLAELLDAKGANQEVKDLLSNINEKQLDKDAARRLGVLRRKL